MERCPCCNARMGGAVICPRCRADLSAVIGTELSAQVWLSKAIGYCVEAKIEKCIQALELSLHQKKTKLAVVLRDFLIKQQCRDVMDLLAQKQLISAKQRLYNVRLLFPHSNQLQQLNSFTDYLLVNNQEQSEKKND